MTQNTNQALFFQLFKNLGIPSLESKFLDVEIWQWGMLFIMLVTGPLIKRIFHGLFLLAEKIFSKTENQIDDLIFNILNSPGSWILTAVYWYYFSMSIGLTTQVNEAFYIFLKIFFFIQLYRAAIGLSNHTGQFISIISKSVRIDMAEEVFPLITRSSKVIIILVLPLFALQNLGVNVMSLVAGLGLGGLAFALAARDTAANLFGSLMILIDRPFKTGDYVVIDGQSGTVVEIGLRSTRIRTFYNSLISVPNAEVANKSIDNMGKREYRRVKTLIDLTYDTSPEKIEALLESIKEIIEAHPDTNKENYHVVFDGFGASALQILVYLFIKVEDWSRELVVKQNIYLDIIRAAHELEIEFAFPTTTLHIDSYTNAKNKPTEKSPGELKKIAKSFREKANPTGVGIYTPIFEQE
jgi:MscS family membrane protein